MARQSVRIARTTAGSGRFRATLDGEAFAFPTAVATRGATLLVVNAQLDRMGAALRLPFSLLSGRKRAAVPGAPFTRPKAGRRSRHIRG